jgi:cytochrome c biogenesis protein ResB
MVTGQGSTASTSRRDLLDNVWRAVGSEYVTIALLFAACAILVLASILPQPPRSVVSEPDSIDRWVMTISSRYGQAGPTIANLGLFSIGRSWWFRLISAFATLHLLVRFADFSHVAHRSLLPTSDPPEGPLYSGHTEADITLSATSPAALERVRQVLGDTGMSIKCRGTASDHPVPDHLDAHRAPLSTLAPVTVCLGLLLVLLSAWTDDMWGWSSQENELVQGQQLVLDRELDWSATLDRAASSLEAGSIAVTTANRQTEHAEIALTRPARYRGVTLRQVTSGPVLRVSASDANGMPLTVQSGQREEAGGLALIFNRTRAERQVTIPEANLALRVVVLADAGDPEMNEPQFVVDAYEGGSLDPVYSATVTSGSQFHWEEATVQLETERFATMTASRQPGESLRLVGALQILVGLVIPLLCPGLQVWARLAPGRRATGVRFLATGQGAGSRPEDGLDLIISALGGHDVEET